MGGVGMANIKSAKKRILVNQTKADRNKAIKSSVKTAVKKVYAAIEANDKDTAAKALLDATAAIDIVDAAFVTEDDIMDYTAYFANAGVRVVLNTLYPFQLYAQGSFSLKLSEGWDYYYNGGYNRYGGIGLGAGFRYCF